MADSRVLDDVEELLIPAAIAIGGIYIVWWLGKFLDRGYEDITNFDFQFPGGTIFEEVATPLREGGLIDRWTISPREWRSIGRRAGRTIRRRWLPW